MPPPPGKQPPPRRPPSGAVAAAAPRATGAAPARRPPVKKAAPASKLVAQSGPASGQEFNLEGDELVIGRAADNPVSIPDTSVSRKHALVRKTADGWAVSDLGSGNGTLLNGEPIAEETQLSDGDVITLGDTELRYAGAGGGGASAEDTSNETGASAGRRPPVRTARNGGGAIERSTGRGRPVRTSRMAEDPEAAAKKRKKLFLIVGGSMVVILALLVGGKAISNKKAEKDKIAAAQSREHQAAMADLFKEAKTLVRQGKWAEAKAKLEEMQAEDVDFETRQVENYLKIADAEIPNQQLLVEGNDFIQKGELAKANAALSKVKTTTQEAALRAAKDALDAKVSEKMGEGRSLLVAAGDLGKMEQLKAICEDILAVKTDDREAAELKKQAETAIYRIKNPTVAPPPPDTPWLEVQQRYKNGDSSGALSLAQACANKFAQCRNLESQIKEFETKSKRVEELNENDLIAMYELDKKIAGGSSSELSRPLRTQLVSKLFVKASQAKTTGNWSRAIEYARKVLQADPGHVGAAALVNEARGQARDVYLRGYQLKESSPDEAVKLFKDVMNMTPPDDETHQKAKSRIQEIQK
ncbi:MAG: FHA domain-containing protein, partial [Archangium sp.]|nr:FHA domain-containing protein [Archangium sp.]